MAEEDLRVVTAYRRLRGRSPSQTMQEETFKTSLMGNASVSEVELRADGTRVVS